MHQPQLLDLKQFNDQRGFLRKLESPKFKELQIKFIEFYISQSHQGVLRGLHFQAGPGSMWKAVTCLSGHVFDAVVDVRPGSTTYGTLTTYNLQSSNPQVLLIPPGFAHGFQSLIDGSQLLFQTDQPYDPTYDTGVSWKSFPDIWPIKKPILSERDQNFVLLKDYDPNRPIL